MPAAIHQYGSMLLIAMILLIDYSIAFRTYFVIDRD